METIKHLVLFLLVAGMVLGGFLVAVAFVLRDK
jgi:hypothetical protein